MDEIIIKKELDLESFSEKDLDALVATLYYKILKIKGENKRK